MPRDSGSAARPRIHPALPLPEPNGFLWATGIEDTFIVDPHPRTGRTLDEYALTEHYERWEEDLRLIADLGVSAARYGIPWYRVCPEPSRYDWSWTDRVLDRMVNTHRIEPIIDLVHYGTPTWMDGSFFHPDYPSHVADYAHAFADRYHGLCYWYTPLNEPRINAWYAGRLGWWPPYGRTWRAFLQMMLQLCKGICRTQRAIESIEPSAVFVHVDATDLYIPEPADDDDMASEARIRQEIVFLALDLVMGRFTASHALYAWFGRTGGTEADMAWFSDNRVLPHVVGINMYPMFSRKIVRRGAGKSVRVSIRSCWTETLDEVARMYAARYDPLPIMITETASAGSINRRIRWIEDSAAAVRELRASGVPLVGYTFWPLFSLVTWAYRNGDRPVDSYLIDMGLYDLRPSPSGLERVATPGVDAFRHLTSQPP